MANDPAFLFYPGDYLRDTQCLSEAAQVAYDRIICEHMRNISISKQQLNFFTKRLNNEQKEELMMVLSKSGEGFQINWVVDSIMKRRAYSDSRRNNRSKKIDKKENKICKTYDSHMDNEIEIEDEIENNKKGVQGEKPKHWESEKNTFLNAGNWIFKFCTDKKIKVETFDTLANEFISDVELKEDFKTVKELRNHFTNWYNLKSKSNGADQRITERYRNGKNAGAFQLLESLREDLRNG